MVSNDHIKDSLRGDTQVDNLPVPEKLPLSQKANVIKELTRTVSTNEYGLPNHIYRADMIPANYNELSAQERGEILDIAAQQLEYDQGFPTVASGEPFWGKLPFETTEAYNAFVQYLELTMPEATNANAAEEMMNPNLSANTVVSHNESSRAHTRSPIRQLHILAPIVGIDTASLLSYSYMFYWTQRAQAYDLFLVACHRKRKERLTLELEGQHYKMSSQLLQTSSQILENALAEIANKDYTERDITCEWKMRDVTDVMWKMFQMQRISLGLSPTGGGGKSQSSEAPQNASVEVTLKNIAAEAGIQASVEEKGLDNNTSEQILQDPEALLAAQELIIKLNPKHE